METLQRHARRNHHHVLRLIVVVDAVLLVHFLGGAGDHHGGVVQGELFRFDALGEVVILFDGLGLGALIEQAAPLLPAQGMAGVHQRHAQQARQAGAHVAAVGIVAVDQVRHLADVAEIVQGVVGEAVEIGPQYFFAQIAARPAGDADDEGLVRQLLLRPGVILGDLGILHHARE